MTDEEMAELYANEYGFGSDCNNITSHEANQEIKQAFLAGLKAGRPKWHKLDWEKDYPEVDRLVRVRTKYNETEYICRTYLYIPAEDEIGYGTTITQFEQLNGDWVDDTEIEYWCYIEPFNFKEIEISQRCWQEQKNISLDTNCKLHKAKELLKWALHSDPEHDEDFDQKWEEAEQFLKEE